MRLCYRTHSYAFLARWHCGGDLAGVSLRPMKRNSFDQDGFNLLPMLNDFALNEGLRLTDGAAGAAFLKRLSAAIREHLGHAARLYGLRAQAMFAHVAAALGLCRVISEEDSGAFFSDAEGMRRPDFRVITRDGQQFLVEVKNYHQRRDPTAPHKMDPGYVAGLLRYASLMSLPLKLAVYWSKWKVWTMVDVRNPNDSTLSMGEGLKKNEMGTLGDRMVSSVPPIELRLYADKTRPRPVDASGFGRFTIGRAVMCAGGKEITCPIEVQLAWFFMRYGQWTQNDRPGETRDSKLEWLGISVGPPIAEDQPHSSLGFLSSMASRRYLELTSEGRSVKLLTPKCDPADLAVLIPDDYHGDVLKIWRWKVVPSLEDVVSTAEAPHSGK